MVQAIGTPTETACQMVSSIVSHSSPCTSHRRLKTNERLLNPSNASDGYSDWDEDGLNNLEEYQVALKFGLLNGLPSFTSPWSEDTDGDGMPDGWEASQYNRTTLSTHSIHVTPAMQMMTSISMVGIPMETETSFSMGSN